MGKKVHELSSSAESLRRINTWLANERDRLTCESRRNEEAAVRWLSAFVITAIAFVLYLLFTLTGVAQ